MDATSRGPELAPFDPVTKAELLELLSSCKGATSTGLDGVSYDVLKHILHYDEKDLLHGLIASWPVVKGFLRNGKARLPCYPKSPSR